MARTIKWFLIIIVVVCGAILYYQPAGFHFLDLGQSEAMILRIVDGDTFEIRFDGRKEKVRLIGIDTPESRENEKAEKDASRTGKDLATIVQEGHEAAAFVGTLVTIGTRVRVEQDVQPRDRYGRLLAYLFFEDGRMINEEIIKAGYASPMTYPPNVKYQELFLSAYRFAKVNKKGLWKE